MLQAIINNGERAFAFTSASSNSNSFETTGPPAEKFSRGIIKNIYLFPLTLALTFALNEYTNT